MLGFAPEGAVAIASYSVDIFGAATVGVALTDTSSQQVVFNPVLTLAETGNQTNTYRGDWVNGVTNGVTGGQTMASTVTYPVSNALGANLGASPLAFQIFANSLSFGIVGAATFTTATPASGSISLGVATTYGNASIFGTFGAVTLGETGGLSPTVSMLATAGTSFDETGGLSAVAPGTFVASGLFGETGGFTLSPNNKISSSATFAETGSATFVGTNGLLSNIALGTIGSVGLATKYNAYPTMTLGLGAGIAPAYSVYYFPAAAIGVNLSTSVSGVLVRPIPSSTINLIGSLNMTIPLRAKLA